MFAQCFRYAKVTLDQTEQGSGTHAAQDLLRCHRPSCVTSSWKCSIQTLFHDMISYRLFPLAFPQLDDLDKVTEVDGVVSGLGEQFSHGFPVDRVDLFTSARVTMEKTSVELISLFVSLHHPSTNSLPNFFSLPLIWCRMSRPVRSDSQVNHSAAICPYSCADSGRKSFSSRRRVYHRHVLHE